MRAMCRPDEPRFGVIAGVIVRFRTRLRWRLPPTRGSELVSNQASWRSNLRIAPPRPVMVAALVAMTGCDFMNREAPEVSKPLGYATIRVDLPGCETPLPPVREATECGALEIGKSIDASDVCDLLESLKKWVISSRLDCSESAHLDDWTQVRAMCISSGFWAQSPHDKRILPPRPFLRLEADLSQSISPRMGVQTVSPSAPRGLEYYVTAR